MRSPKYETCQPKMNESFFKTIDLVLVASSSSICHIGGKKTPKTYRFFIGILCLFSDIRFFIDYYFCRDFGKSFHTCTNRGNCQKSKLFPWPKTTLWHLPTSYVSIFVNLFSVQNQCFEKGGKSLKGEYQQLSNEYSKRQQQQRLLK